jgi:hypothetical protein
MSFVLRPTWVSEWMMLMRTPHEYFLMPVTVLGGPLILLALLRWRRPEARLLAALACIPQTFSSYDALLLFLVVRTRRESLILVSLILVVTALIGAFGVSPPYTETVHSWAPVRIALVYLPAVAMVLRRRNEGPAPRWLDRALTSPLDGCEDNRSMAPRLKAKIFASSSAYRLPERTVRRAVPPSRPAGKPPNTTREDCADVTVERVVPSQIDRSDPDAKGKQGQRESKDS